MPLTQRHQVRLAHVQHLVPASGPLSQNLPSQATDGLALGILREIIDGAGAINPGQGTDREMLDAAGLQFVQRFERGLA